MRSFAYFSGCGQKTFDIVHFTTNEPGLLMEIRLFQGCGVPDTAAYFTEDQVRELAGFLLYALDLSLDQIEQFINETLQNTLQRKVHGKPETIESSVASLQSEYHLR